MPIDPTALKAQVILPLDFARDDYRCSLRASTLAQSLIIGTALGPVVARFLIIGKKVA